MMLTIGRLARQTGLTPRAIRHYEKLGLLKPPGRTPSNYRIYEPCDIERLAFVANCRALGFSIPEIADLIGMLDDPDHTCAQVAALAGRHIRQADARLEELIEARDRIAHVLEQCSGTEDPECPMLDDLGGMALPSEDQWPARHGNLERARHPATAASRRPFSAMDRPDSRGVR